MNVLNGLLIIAAAAMSFGIAIPILHPDTGISLPAVKETIAEASKISTLPQNASLSDYAIIGDQNLFHPDRIIPPEKKEEKAIPKPEVILYGTLITGQMSIAFVEDKKAPRTTPGRGKRQTALHKGDQLSGYVLREIESNRIVFVKGEEKLVVLLEEGEKRKAPSDTQLPTPAGMMPGSPQQAAPVMPGSAFKQPPAQRNAQTAPSPSPAVAAPGSTGPDDSWPTSRRGKLAEVQRRKAERQTATE